MRLFRLNPREWIESPAYEKYNAPYRRWRDRLLCEPGKALVIAGLVLGFLSVDLSFRQAYVFWSLLFGLGAGSFIVTRFARFPVKLERHAPARVTAGSQICYAVVVTNESAGTLHDLAVREEDLPWGVKPVHEDGVGPVIPVLHPGESRTVRLSARFEHRGVRDLSGVRVERTCALGLTRSGRTLAGRSRVIVHPRHLTVQKIDFTTARVYQPGGIPSAAATGESTEFLGLRDYRPGDSLRHISWQAWARTGQPVVREYQAEYYRRVAIVLDTRTRDGSRGERDAFEAAVAATASITRYFDEHEYVIDLFAAGPDIYYMQAGRGLSLMDSVLDLLALVEPSRAVSFPRLDGPLCRVLNRLSGLVLVTTDWWSETRKFHSELLTEVPEIKVLLVRPDAPTLSPDDDVPEPRLLKRVHPETIERDLEVV